MKRQLETDTDDRLLPRWYGVVVTLLLTIVGAVLLVVGLAVGELSGAAGALLGVACLLLAVAAVRALLWPRRRARIEPAPDGVIVIRSAPVVAWCLVLAWLLLVLVAAMWAVLAVVDFDAIESPGFALVAVIGALGSLPDLVRLCTGRLHRWELTLGRDGYRYRGYRTDDAAPWAKVHGASIQRRGPAGVLIDRKGTGPDIVVPAAAFDVPAEQLVEEIRARLALRD